MKSSSRPPNEPRTLDERAATPYDQAAQQWWAITCPVGSNTVVGSATSSLPIRLSVSKCDSNFELQFLKFLRALTDAAFASDLVDLRVDF